MLKILLENKKRKKANVRDPKLLDAVKNKDNFDRILQNIGKELKRKTIEIAATKSGLQRIKRAKT